LFADICGPIAPTCATGYTNTYFLKKKPEAPDVLDESHHSERITTTDADNVYIRGLFQQRCRRLDITSVYSHPHEYKHNGSSERTFRDIGDLAHTTMATHVFPSTGWNHYAKLDDDTPYYRMFGKNYDMSNVRIFGCRAFVHIPLAQRATYEPRAAESVYVGHDDASSAYPIYFPATDRTNVVGTPNFIEDVGTCASRLIDSASVSALPLDPPDLFYNKPTPFHDTVNPKTTFDIVDLGAWYSQQDHELISMEQLRETTSDKLRPAATGNDQPEPDCDLFWTSSDQLQPAATGGDQPEPDCDPFWTTLTRYVSDSSPLLPSRLTTVHFTIAPWRHHGSLGVSCPFFYTDTVTDTSSES
jgi:hypothetical protein